MIGRRRLASWAPVGLCCYAARKKGRVRCPSVRGFGDCLPTFIHIWKDQGCRSLHWSKERSWHRQDLDDRVIILTWVMPTCVVFRNQSYLSLCCPREVIFARLFFGCLAMRGSEDNSKHVLVDEGRLAVSISLSGQWFEELASDGLSWRFSWKKRIIWSVDETLFSKELVEGLGNLQSKVNII